MFNIFNFFIEVLENLGYEIFEKINDICDKILDASNNILPPRLNPYLEEDCTPPMIKARIKIEEDASEYKLIEGE